jgi:hypothetical protein
MCMSIYVYTMFLKKEVDCDDQDLKKKYNNQQYLASV